MGFELGNVDHLDNDISLISFLLVVVFVIFSDYATGILEYYLESTPMFERMLQLIYKELMLMGLVSFTVIMIEAKEARKASGVSHEVHLWFVAIDFAHILLFYMTLLFVAHAFFFIATSSSYAKKYRSTFAQPLSSLIADLESTAQRMSSKLAFRTSLSSLKERADFHLARYIFRDSYLLPKDFNYPMYISGCFDRHALKTINRSLYSWFFLLLIIVANHLRVRFGLWSCIDDDHNATADDDGHHRKRHLSGDGDDHADPHNNSFAWNSCHGRNVQLFCWSSAALVFFSLILYSVAREYKRRFLSRLVPNNSLSDYIAYFKFVEKKYEEIAKTKIQQQQQQQQENDRNSGGTTTDSSFLYMPDGTTRIKGAELLRALEFELDETEAEIEDEEGFRYLGDKLVEIYNFIGFTATLAMYKCTNTMRSLFCREQSSPSKNRSGKVEPSRDRAGSGEFSASEGSMSTILHSHTGFWTNDNINGHHHHHGNNNNNTNHDRQNNNSNCEEESSSVASAGANKMTAHTHLTSIPEQRANAIGDNLEGPHEHILLNNTNDNYNYRNYHSDIQLRQQQQPSHSESLKMSLKRNIVAPLPQQWLSSPSSSESHSDSDSNPAAAAPIASQPHISASNNNVPGVNNEHQYPTTPPLPGKVSGERTGTVDYTYNSSSSTKIIGNHHHANNSAIIHQRRMKALSESLSSKQSTKKSPAAAQKANGGSTGTTDGFVSSPTTMQSPLSSPEGSSYNSPPCNNSANIPPLDDAQHQTASESQNPDYRTEDAPVDTKSEEIMGPSSTASCSSSVNASVKSRSKQVSFGINSSMEESDHCPQSSTSGNDDYIFGQVSQAVNAFKNATQSAKHRDSQQKQYLNSLSLTISEQYLLQRHQKSKITDNTGASSVGTAGGAGVRSPTSPARSVRRRTSSAEEESLNTMLERSNGSAAGLRGNAAVNKVMQRRENRISFLSHANNSDEIGAGVAGAAHVSTTVPVPISILSGEDSEIVEAATNALYDYSGVYIGNNPHMFFRAVEMCVMLNSLYISLWLTNFLIITAEEIDLSPIMRIIVNLIMVVPIFVVFPVLGVISETASMLEASMQLNLEVLLDVLKRTEEQRSMMNEIRSNILLKIAQKFGEREMQLNHQKIVQKVFSEIDRDGSGSINRTEFRLLLRKMNIHYSEKRFNLLFRGIDVSNTGGVELGELDSFLFPRSFDSM